MKRGVAWVAVSVTLLLMAGGALGKTREPMHGRTLVQRVADTSCVQGFALAPQGPFAVLVSCQDAIGNYLSVIFAAQMDQVLDAAWNVDAVAWHESRWGDDVTSYAWADSGERLYVGTENINGTAGVWELDLRKKKSRRLFPTSPVSDSVGAGFEIRGIDEARRVLSVERWTQDYRGPRNAETVTVPMGPRVKAQR